MIENKLTDLENAITIKHKLLDINNQLLLPKQFVAFRYGSSLYKGIILSINQKTTTVLTNEIDSRLKYIVYPKEQIIINNTLTDEIIKQNLLTLYDNEVNKPIKRDFIRYIICAFINTKTRIPGIIIFEYKLNKLNRHNKIDWDILLNQINTTYPDYDFYCYSKKTNRFDYLINSKYGYKETAIYHTKHMGALITHQNAQNNLLYIIDNLYTYCLTFDLNKTNVLNKINYNRKHDSSDNFLSTDNFYIQIFKDKRNSSFVDAWNSWLNEFNDINLIRDFKKSKW
jgi:hypothetical protein